MNASLDLVQTFQYWREYEDRSIYTILHLMDHAEKWIMIHIGLEKEIQKLLNLIHKKDFIVYNDMQKKTIIYLCNRLHMSRSLRLLQIIDATNPGMASSIIAFADQHQEEVEESLFFSRNIHFERLRLLYRVFQIDRVESMMTAMKESPS